MQPTGHIVVGEGTWDDFISFFEPKLTREKPPFDYKGNFVYLLENGMDQDMTHLVGHYTDY
jgi:hypothetical protein